MNVLAALGIIKLPEDETRQQALTRLRDQNARIQALDRVVQVIQRDIEGDDRDG